jgi:hypothetical protein
MAVNKAAFDRKWGRCFEQVFSCDIIQVMQHLRHATYLTRLVLVWFALSVGVAIASPIVNPHGMDLVCTSTGSMKLVVQGDDEAAASSHTLDCPLCAAISAPPPAINTSLTQPSPLAHAMQPIAAAHIAAVTAPPLPSRGPPTFSL